MNALHFSIESRSSNGNNNNNKAIFVVVIVATMISHTFPIAIQKKQTNRETDKIVFFVDCIEVDYRRWIWPLNDRSELTVPHFASFFFSRSAVLALLRRCLCLQFFFPNFHCGAHIRFRLLLYSMRQPTVESLVPNGTQVLSIFDDHSDKSL